MMVEVKQSRKRFRYISQGKLKVYVNATVGSRDVGRSVDIIDLITSML